MSATRRRAKRNPAWPEVGTPIDIEWECPDWCVGGHHEAGSLTNGYLLHGHVVHMAKHPLSSGGALDFWYSNIYSWREDPDATVEAHLCGPFIKFSTGDELRAYAAELTVVADLLDARNAEVLS